MEERGIPIEDFWRQYCISIYFVTTTLSTCGYGDIIGSTGSLDNLLNTLQMILGMLFYSYSIDQIQ
jgi:hypothetical protein